MPRDDDDDTKVLLGHPTPPAPTIRILSVKVPARVSPYLELMRVHKPAGLYAFYLPCIYGILHGATTSPPSDPPTDPLRLLLLAFIFLVANIFIRGYACTWNDYIDQDFDRQVVRTKNRPIARGAVSNKNALIFTLANGAAVVPLLFILPATARWYLIPITLLWIFYPFAKRITYYPQLVLGFPFALAVPMASSSVAGVSYFSVHHVDSGVMKSLAALFASVVIWTILYDTIYAFQDIRDDAKAGVKSTALRFSKAPKAWLSLFAAAQVALLVATGFFAHYSIWYYIGTPVATTLALAFMIWKVDLEDPESCGWWFWGNFWVVGTPIGLGFLAVYCEKLVLAR